MLSFVKLEILLNRATISEKIDQTIDSKIFPKSTSPS